MIKQLYLTHTLDSNKYSYLRDRMDQGLLAIKGYSTFSNATEIDPHSRHGGVLYLG